MRSRALQNSASARGLRNMNMETTTLFRPVGTKELALIEAADNRAFPPRLSDQPIFYPVMNEGYARQIAKDWNSRLNDDREGYVTRFAVRKDVADQYGKEVVGAREHEELWVPAEELDAFNAAIVGEIEVIAKFANDELVWEA